MTVHLCATCGTSYPDAASPPARCAICDDERQYVPASGQAWTTRAALLSTYSNAWRQHEAGLHSIHPQPILAINQRAFLVQTPAGNVLWDCVALLDPATETLVRAMGGIAAIAISHPHYYTVMQDWAEAFDAPIHLHAADRQWVQRPSRHIAHWEGETLEIAPGATLIRAGGHYPGGTVLHWSGAADGKGVLLAGDIVQITPGGHKVSFMWSYPNMMPLPASEIARIAACLAPWRYDRIYGAFRGQEIPANGPDILARSAARYIELLEGKL